MTHSLHIQALAARFERRLGKKLEAMNEKHGPEEGQRTGEAQVTWVCGGFHCRAAPGAAGEAPHGCPYASEINDNQDPEFCTCCEDCERECRDDI